ncbi:thioredoxin domain-containing protein [Teichococcus aestuarii]|uniref:hypothetical protein n=1 Tax=Teichococcus aestuarii TaxID=568898 RepID=UPI0011B22CD4|nr:hypothetical protein [Pseudoroseomonas aestuarii]
MPASVSDLYKAHVKNLRAVEAGIAQIERDLNRALAEENVSLAETLKKLLLFLVGAWAECRLKKLIYEAQGFSSANRELILAERTQAARWKRALEIGYRKRYNIPRAPLSESTLPGTAWFRLTAIQKILSEYLEPIIGLRNTLAHGQWERPLNSDETEISGSLIAQMNQENALTIKFKMSLIESTSALIHDLVSATSFERDFDVHYRHAMTARTNLSRRSYEKWRASMVEKKVRGRLKRDAAIAALS